MRPLKKHGFNSRNLNTEGPPTVIRGHQVLVNVADQDRDRKSFLGNSDELFEVLKALKKLDRVIVPT
jgi:hypothetical protein